MNRREVLQRSAMVLGYAITGPALVGILKGCKAQPELNYKPDFFTEDQAELISELAEVIIPKTTTPGAKEVGVPGFIDSMIKEVYSKEEQENFIKGLTAFDADAKKTYGEVFAECEPEQRLAHVKKYHDEALSKSREGASWGWWSGKGNDNKPFIIKVKELTLLGFFTSKQGAEEVLQYNQVPGPFQGCVPLKKVGKTWAT